VHGAPGPWTSARDEEAPDTTPKHLPYRPQYRHPMWFIDIRYLVKLDGNWVYSICMLEGSSRKILAGMASAHQALTAVLQLLFAALAEYGCPEMIISDHGAVFRAEDYQRLLRALEIEPTYIELRKPWQNLIEAQFKVQLRLADFQFERAQTLEEIQTLHAAFIETFNTTRHWAHLEREDGRRTPVEVLEWVRGRPVERTALRRLFGEVQFLRMVNRYGFVSVQRFYIYAEPGLARQRVAIWVYEGELRMEYQATLLARYRCTYDQRHRRLQAVSHPVLYPTPFASPQLEVLELDEAQWVKVQQRAWYRRPRQVFQMAEQLPLLEIAGSVTWLVPYLLINGMRENFFQHVFTVI